MTNRNPFAAIIALSAVLIVVLGCNSLKEMANSANTAGNVNSAPANTMAANSATAPAKKGIVSADDPAEFTFTAEAIYKEFKADKDSTIDDKYLDKIVAVTGRFKDFDTGKKDTEGGYAARLTAGGFLDWVECSVDEENKAEFEKLKKDEMVTFKGMGNRFWLAGPRFKHCVVATK